MKKSNVKITEVEFIVHYENGEIESRCSIPDQFDKPQFNTGVIVNDNNKKVMSIINNVAGHFEIYIEKMF